MDESFRKFIEELTELSRKYGIYVYYNDGVLPYDHVYLRKEHGGDTLEIVYDEVRREYITEA
jgi:hypothetical protein